MLRHFDRTQNSEYWNSDTREAVGGPKYVYSDSAILGVSAFAYSTSRIGDIGVRNTPPGLVIMEKRKMYVEWDVNVDFDDEIYELSAHTTAQPTITYDRTAENVSNYIVYPKTRWVVKDIHNYRSDDQGRVEYKMLLLERG